MQRVKSAAVMRPISICRRGQGKAWFLLVFLDNAFSMKYNELQGERRINREITEQKRSRGDGV